jgi:phosphatidylserine/phosphatidylglycerophosphate/cardiolipin synthase-like enzyme
MSSLNLRVITAADYYDALLRGIPKAKKRIVINAMAVLWGPRTETLLPLLHDALERGAEVHIVGDIYSKFEANIPRLHRDDGTPKWSHTLAVNTELRAHGAHITYVGKLGLNPFKRRCHSKITLIDDTVYSFGGVNFTSGSFGNHDYMLTTQDTQLAERLYLLVHDIGKDQRLIDFSEPLDTSLDLLFDGGTPDSSAIYDAACDMVGNAKKVYYVSQMCPSGRLAKLLTTTESTCYFSRSSQAEPPLNVTLPVERLFYRIANHYKGKNYIHAKFILCEGKDGSNQLISGSNNFSWRGVAYGTKEIAIRSSDPKLWQTLYQYMQEEIIGPAPLRQ